MLILVSKPFTGFVPGEGMVVGNRGDVVELPDNMAQNRIEAGFATTEGVLEARDLADGEMLEEGDMLAGDALADAIAKGAVLGLSESTAAKVKPGRKPSAAASPVDAPVA